MKLLRYLLFPIVPIYYMVTWIRNKLYDKGIFESVSYGLPIICVGNLSVGGTGKTPMIEYLIRLLKNEYIIATLSRGYKRSTKGFRIADKNSSASDLGDEPFQFYKKFQNVIVSVDADRRNGISQLLGLKSPPNLILLDDAYQHRKVRATFNILLTPYHDLYTNDMLLPTGNLREPIRGADRAKIIVVTKCPENLSEIKKDSIRADLNCLAYQKVFFSSIVYSDEVLNDQISKPLEYFRGQKFTLVTGIANPKPMIEFLNSIHLDFDHLKFPDHYEFKESDIQNLKSTELILTTEKDFMRLSLDFEDQSKLFYLPIEVKIDEQEAFDDLIHSSIKE